MLSRDLIASVIKTFFQELDDVRDGKKQQMELPYADFYNAYFNHDREWFMKANVPEITAYFASDPVYKMEMFLELMFRDAKLVEIEDIRAALFHKIIELYEILDSKSDNFSVERMNRLAELKALTS